MPRSTRSRRPRSRRQLGMLRSSSSARLDGGSSIAAGFGRGRFASAACTDAPRHCSSAARRHGDCGSSRARHGVGGSLLVASASRSALFRLEQRLPVGDRDLVVVGMDFAEGEEAVAVAAILDEGGLQGRFDPRDLGEVDIAAQLPPAGAISKSNSSTRFPRMTTTRVSSGWVASISILLAMMNSRNFEARPDSHPRGEDGSRRAANRASHVATPIGEEESDSARHASPQLAAARAEPIVGKRSSTFRSFLSRDTEHRHASGCGERGAALRSPSAALGSPTALKPRRAT